MTTASVFWGALLALSVYEFIHLAVKEIVYQVNRKRSKKRFDSILAKLEESTFSYGCSDECEICEDNEGTITIPKYKAKPVRRPVKKAVAKKKTVKKAAPKRK